jgi:hypothetical protein
MAVKRHRDKQEKSEGSEVSRRGEIVIVIVIKEIEHRNAIVGRTLYSLDLPRDESTNL